MADGADRTLPLATVSTRTGLSAADIRSESAAGRFPAPLPLGPWDFGWSERAVEAWLAQRARQQDDAG